jgi:tripartite-type tricarboxylate transporter receptor subunit TctC
MGAVALTVGCVQAPDRQGPYPDGDINLIVPAKAGETTDALLDAEPDGHTLMISSVGSTVVTPLLFPEKDYGFDDFRFLGVVHSAPVVLFTAADSPVDSAETLLVLARPSGETEGGAELLDGEGATSIRVNTTSPSSPSLTS